MFYLHRVQLLKLLLIYGRFFTQLLVALLFSPFFCRCSSEALSKLNLSFFPKETNLFFYINNCDLVKSKVANVFIEPNCFRRTTFRGLFLQLFSISSIISRETGLQVHSAKSSNVNSTVKLLKYKQQCVIWC